MALTEVGELAASGWKHYAEAMVDLMAAIAIAEPQNDEAQQTIDHIDSLIKQMAELRLQYRGYVWEVIGDD